MKTSQFFISTLKELPSEAELISHKLMLRAGLIKKVSSGLYTWMPLGLLVLKKVQKIIREEMNKAGSIELFMPVVQPAELWEESGRWAFFGKDLLKFKDRHSRDFCLGATHEEVISDIVRNEINSYKQLPISFYQIQTKFRDEIRPRFGVMRSREFIMKDAYSFHENFESLDETYQIMYNAYCSIFDRLGLNYRPVAADTGGIGGTGSHEFQVLAESGEDIIAYSDVSQYAANVELAETIAPLGEKEPIKEELIKIHTPDIKTIHELVSFLNCSIEKTVKSIVVKGKEENELILFLLRGDHVLNEIKAKKLPYVSDPLTFASEDEIKKVFDAKPGFLGPIGFSGKIYADFSLQKGADWIVGANENDHHLTGFNFFRESVNPEFVDIRNIEEGDPSPDGEGVIKFVKGIEVGHVFQLRTKYSEAMNVVFLDKNGKKQYMEMGCYGIGVTRIVAAAIEQNNDEKGIIWTDEMTPFSVIIVPMNYHKNEEVKNMSDHIYQQLSEMNIEVLLDDRNERAGVLLSDSELIGIPHRIVIGDRGLKEGIVEYYDRKNNQSKNISVNEIVSLIQNILN